MDQLIKYFIGGSLALMTFFLLAPSIITGMTDAQLDFTSYGEINSTTAFNDVVTTFENTTAITVGDTDFIVLAGGNNTGYFEAPTPGEYRKLEVTADFPAPDNSSARVEVGNNSYELSQGTNEIVLPTSTTDNFRVYLEKDPALADQEGPGISSFTAFEGSENSYSGILGLLFILFTVVGVWKFYEST